MTYTLAQIRQAGKEGEVNHLDVEHIIDLLKEQPNSDGQLPVGNQIFNVYKKMPDCPLKNFLAQWFSKYDDKEPQKSDGQKEPLYRWVRASEFQPDKRDSYAVRWKRFDWEENGTYEYGTGFYHDDKEAFKRNYINYEWLCKVETPEQDELWREALEILEPEIRQADTTIEKLSKQYLLIKKINQ